jgi:hypothetical protein
MMKKLRIIIMGRYAENHYMHKHVDSKHDFPISIFLKIKEFV